MMIRRLMAASEQDSAKYRPYINTGGPLDIINGKFIPTVDGGFALSGGLGLTTAIIAEANKFKSTLLNGSAINALARFPDSQFFVNDSEYSSLDPYRLASMSDLYFDEPEKRENHIKDLVSRISLFDPTTPQAESGVEQ